ncbi:MAG: GLUG motif-containing protein, partial [Candidatus Saliniplasma sp.]
MSMGISPVAVTSEQSSETLSFDGGDGSERDPYQISNWTHLDAVRGNFSAHYTLTTSLDSTTDGYETYVNTTEGWEPIGNFSTLFEGAFDGQDNTITGLYINRSETNYMGLFGNLNENAQVQNVGVENADITGSRVVGALAAQSSGMINNSYATGNVSGFDLTGGLVGRHYGEVNQTYATVNVDGDYQDIGGLVGFNAQDSLVNNSYATGDVEGPEYVGGLNGRNNHGFISNSYATGIVTGTSNDGGLVGINNNGTVTDSYWDTETTGQDTSDGGTGLNTTDMMTQSTFSGWDFIDTWWMVDGETRPFLQMEWDTNVSNSHQLQMMEMNKTVDYKLTDDIDLSGIQDASQMWGTNSTSGEGWKPIGNSSVYFTGSFDGNDYIISDLTINRSSENYVGLFGDLNENAHVQNVGLENADVTGNSVVGVLAGEIYGKISNSYATGKVSGHDRTGGLVGRNRGEVKQTYATVNVEGEDQYIGGLIGTNSDGNTDYSSVIDSYATGDVDGYQHVGGLNGGNYGSGSSISNSYATGYVTGSSNVGGLVGWNYGGTVIDSYWDTETTGQSDGIGSGNGDVEGLTTAEMKGESATTNMNAFDFTSTWDVVSGSHISYPYLRNNPQNPAPGFQTSYAGGDGSAGDPYQISNWYHLNNTGENLGANYTLVDDIDDTTDGYEEYVNTTNGWDPIGDGYLFYGSFDGQGHVVNDLWINRTTEDSVGLFEGSGGKLENIGVVGANVTGNDYVGGLVGYNSGTVNNSYFNVNVNGTGNYVGGLVGRNDGTVKNSYFNGNVNGADSVGGLVGENYYSTVENSYATGNVSGFYYVGGFVGENYYGTVNNSYATGNVSGYQYVGGLVGYNDNTVNNSYFNGNVNGTDSVGGLVGGNGIDGTVKNSYATGDVSGEEH